MVKSVNTSEYSRLDVVNRPMHDIQHSVPPKDDLMDPEMVSNLCAMGFTPAQAEVALYESDLDIERAAEWLFSHMDDLDGACHSSNAFKSKQPPKPSSSGSKSKSRSSQYELVGIVSHMGEHTACGHYVCHIRKSDGKWVIYNDEKVAISQNPPLELGYLYLYRQVV